MSDHQPATVHDVGRLIKRVHQLEKVLGIVISACGTEDKKMREDLLKQAMEEMPL